MLAQLIQCCRCEFHTFPGAAAYTQSAAAYTQSAAAYTQGAAAYTQGAAAYMVSAAAYMGKVRIKLTPAGLELGLSLAINIFCVCVLQLVRLSWSYSCSDPNKLRNLTRYALAALQISLGSSPDKLWQLGKVFVRKMGIELVVLDCSLLTLNQDYGSPLPEE